MKAVSEFRPRAAPVLPACGVSRRSWRGLALVNAVPWEQPRLSTPVIRWMSVWIAALAIRQQPERHVGCAGFIACSIMLDRGHRASRNRKLCNIAIP